VLYKKGGGSIFESSKAKKETTTMNEQQNQTRSFVQVKSSKFIDTVSKGYSKPVRNFFNDMITGICGTGKPSLHNIAKYTPDNTSTKKTSERLYRNILRENLAEDIEDILTELIRPQVTNDTLFIVDDSDIAKPYAKSMEGCAKVHNGSESKSTNGYLLMNIFALLTKQDGYSLLPASSILFSPSIELDSAKQVLQDKIVDQQIAFRNKGTYVFDRGYDDRKLIDFLVENGVSFVIRGMGRRAIREGMDEKNFKEEVDKMKFKYKFCGLRKGEELHCATQRIGVRTDDHPSKKANSVEISLVAVRKYRNGSRKGKDFYLLCNFDDPHMSEQDLIAKAIDIYRKRWAIEEVHRQVKQSMKWESMRLKTYRGMKNLNAFMALAIYFIYKLKDHIHILAIGFPKLIIYKKSDRYKVMQFSYYRICEVVATCLTLVVRYRRRPSIEERRDRLQRKIRLD